MFFGKFTALRGEVVLLRLQMLPEILEGRRHSLGKRLKVGIVTAEKKKVFEDL